MSQVKYGMYRVKDCSGYRDYTNNSKGRCIKTFDDVNQAYQKLDEYMTNIQKTKKHTTATYGCSYYSKCKGKWEIREK